MAYCSKCGNRVDNEAAFCSKCGAKIASGSKSDYGKTFSITSDASVRFSEEMVDYIKVYKPFVELFSKSHKETVKLMDNEGYDEPEINIEEDYEYASKQARRIYKLLSVAAASRVLEDFGWKFDDRNQLLKDIMDFTSSESAQTFLLFSTYYKLFEDVDPEETQEEYEDRIEQAKVGLCMLVETELIDSAVYVYKFLVENDEIEPAEFMRKCTCVSRYKKYESVWKKTKKTFTDYENYEITKEEAIERFCDDLSEYPYCLLTYFCMYAIDSSLIGSLLKIASYCGFEEYLRQFTVDASRSTFMDELDVQLSAGLFRL